MPIRKEWFLEQCCGRQVAIYAENGMIAEFSVEGERDGELVGNIYKGKVCNVVAGMQAAFVSCGMDRNGYLPLNEASSEISRYDGKGNPAQLSLKEGDELLVQIDKSPRGNKGARVTTSLSFVGKTLIYLPNTDFLGISRKLTDEAERERLLAEADALRLPGEGIIVRTAAAKVEKKQLKREAEYLRRIYRNAIAEAEALPVGSLIHRECDLPLKVLRDSFGDDIAHIYVADKGLYEKMLRLVRLRSDLPERKISFYTGEESIFTHFHLSDQVYELATPRVELSNGGYLVIDHTEAMTVIDVNTGKFVGDSDLESTVTQTNLLAATEIARQVRLRNIGGIVAVDFIDMAEQEHRLAVTERLEEALSTDKAKCRVQPMNELCVSMFTRKRVNNDIQEFLLKPCPHCTRQGHVLSDMYMVMRIRSAILDHFANGYQAVIIELNRLLMNRILSEKLLSDDVNGIWKNKRVYMIPHSTYHEEKFTVRGDNSSVLNLPDDAQVLY